MTPLSPRECFNLIEDAVQSQIDRLFSPEANSEREKACEIQDALNRLFLATVKKYPEGVEIRHRFTLPIRIDTKQIGKLNLTTVNAMLDAEIRMWENAIPPSIEHDMEFNGRKAGYRNQISLRKALNISRNNIFNSAGGTWGPLWGKTNALELTEKKLGI